MLKSSEFVQKRSSLIFISKHIFVNSLVLLYDYLTQICTISSCFLWNGKKDAED